MRRLVIATIAATSIVGGSAAALAAGGPGPNGHNNFGLCTAYFAGSQTGQDHKHNAPPFQALQQDAQNANESVQQFCQSATPGGK